MKSLKLIQNYVAVEEIPQDEQSPGGVFLPQTVQQPLKKGIVVLVGPGRWEHGKFIRTQVEEGDKVLFSKFAGDTTLTYQGKKYILFRDSEIFGIFE